MDRHGLGEFEHLVLLAVARLGDESYGLRVRNELERRAGRRASIGAVYATLGRLEDKGLLTSWESAHTPRRGGRARRFFRLTTSGARALQSAARQLERMWEGLDIPSGLRA